MLFEAADGRRRNQPLDAEQLEPEDIGPEVQLGRQNPVAGAVPREKRYALAAKRAEQVRTGRITERRLHRHFLAIGQVGHVVQAAAADHANLCCVCHRFLVVVGPHPGSHARQPRMGARPHAQPSLTLRILK